MRRDGLSGSSFRGRRALELKIFFICFPILLAIFFQMRRPAPMRDLSGGLYAETFRTEYPPLRRELVHLHQSGFFGEGSGSGLIPPAYAVWHSAQETTRIVHGERFRAPGYEILIGKGLSEAEKAKHLVFGDALENPVQGELFRTLLCRFSTEMDDSDSRAAASALRDMFRFSSISLNSNSPDIYFLEKSVACAGEYEQKFSGDSAAMAEWRKIRADLMKNCIFPFANICRLERLRSMRDFEKIRLNGIRLFDGLPGFGTRMKEAFYTGSVSLMLDALKTKITDFLYDADRDQAANLAIFREILENGATPQMISPPGRKMSVRSLRRLTRAQEILTASLGYLGKGLEE